MSNDLVKVKPKKDYDWREDNKYVYLKIQMPNVTTEAITTYLSDLVLRITAPNKRPHVFDLFDKIDYQNKQNRYVYVGGVLEFTLVKEK